MKHKLEKISGLRNGNWKISGLRNVNQKISGFHLIRNYPGIPVDATNFWIIPFPKWKFFSRKMETLPVTQQLERLKCWILFGQQWLLFTQQLQTQLYLSYSIRFRQGKKNKIKSEVFYDISHLFAKLVDRTKVISNN